MKTLERRLQEALRDESARLPGEEEARTVEARTKRASRPLRPGFVLPAVIVGVFLLATPLLWLEIGRGANPADSATPLSQPVDLAESESPLTSLAESASTATTGVEFDVAEVDASDADPTDGPGFDPTAVAETLQSTGRTYDELPDAIPDAAIVGGRAVIVGGNSERIAGIWYSDGGAWIPVDIEFPPGVTIGEGEGDYRLADGITHLDVIDGLLVAWEPIQLVTLFEQEEGVNLEPEWAGTIVLTSPAGASWGANIIDHNITAMARWRDGVVATSWTQQKDGRISAAALWSPDFATWTEVADLGEGEPYKVETDDKGITVTLRVTETTIMEDGSIAYGPGQTARKVKLTPPS